MPLEDTGRIRSPLPGAGAAASRAAGKETDKAKYAGQGTEIADTENGEETEAKKEEEEPTAVAGEGSRTPVGESGSASLGGMDQPPGEKDESNELANGEVWQALFAMKGEMDETKKALQRVEASGRWTRQQVERHQSELSLRQLRVLWPESQRNLEFVQNAMDKAAAQQGWWLTGMSADLLQQGAVCVLTCGSMRARMRVQEEVGQLTFQAIPLRATREPPEHIKGADLPLRRAAKAYQEVTQTEAKPLWRERICMLPTGEPVVAVQWESTVVVGLEVGSAENLEDAFRKRFMELWLGSTSEQAMSDATVKAKDQHRTSFSAQDIEVKFTRLGAVKQAEIYEALQASGMGKGGGQGTGGTGTGMGAGMGGAGSSNGQQQQQQQPQPPTQPSLFSQQQQQQPQQGVPQQQQSQQQHLQQPYAMAPGGVPAAPTGQALQQPLLPPPTVQELAPPPAAAAASQQGQNQHNKKPTPKPPPQFMQPPHTGPAPQHARSTATSTLLGGHTPMG